MHQNVDRHNISRSKLHDLVEKTLAEANSVSPKLLEERQAEMRERLAKEKTNRAVTRPSFQQEPVQSNIVAEPDTESQSLDASSSDRAVVKLADGMVTVSRNDLYTLVWAEPMTTVAARFGISANYLARVCAHLNIPHPNRGYWAKLSVVEIGKLEDSPRND